MFFKRRKKIKELKGWLKQLTNAKDLHKTDIAQHVRTELEQNDISAEEIGTTEAELKRDEADGITEMADYYIECAKFDGVPLDPDAIWQKYVRGTPGAIIQNEPFSVVYQKLKDRLKEA